MRRLLCMKKTIAFLLMLLLLFSCSACGKDDQRNEEPGDSETEQQQTQDSPCPQRRHLGLPGKTLSFTMRLLKFITPRFILTHSVSPQKI